MVIIKIRIQWIIIAVIIIFFVFRNYNYVRKSEFWLHKERYQQDEKSSLFPFTLKLLLRARFPEDCEVMERASAYERLTKSVAGFHGTFPA